VQGDLESAVQKILTACDETPLSSKSVTSQSRFTHNAKVYEEVVFCFILLIPENILTYALINILSYQEESEEGEKRLQYSLAPHNEVTHESSEDDEKTQLQMGNNFSVIQYNKARGSLPRRARRKNKLSPFVEIDTTLSLSDIVLPSSASAVSDEEVKDGKDSEIAFLQNSASTTSETPVSSVLVPVPISTSANNNQFMTKLCSKMNNIQQTCFEDPFLHDVLDDMKLLQQAMNKLCRRAMLQTDDEIFTD